MVTSQRSFNLVLLVLGYCLIRCVAPSLSKVAHKVASMDDPDEDMCTSEGKPCPFFICPGDFFRAICQQFSLVTTASYPLKLEDVQQNSTCCKKGDCSDLIGLNDTKSSCLVSSYEIVDIIKETTSCLTSTECVIKHPEDLARLEEKACNLTMKILRGFYYCN